LHQSRECPTQGARGEHAFDFLSIRRVGFVRPLGRKVSDEFTVPLCRTHHRELHSRGDEAEWWNKLNIDPLLIALKLLPAGGERGYLFF